MPTADALSHLVDDATVVYILENRRYFEDLRQVASQLAGLLVLAAAGSKESAPDHPMLTAAAQLHRDAADGLRHSRPTLRARRHHEHVLQAASHLADALSAANRIYSDDVDPVLDPAPRRLLRPPTSRRSAPRLRTNLLRTRLLWNPFAKRGEASIMSAYSLWVMEFAAVPNYPLSGLVYGAHNQGTRKLPYCYIVIKGQGQVAMVDVGYNHKAYGEVLANTYGVKGWHPPKTVLGEIGIAPEDVSSIFITHSHFDHMGNIEDFPKATFYMQERELTKWVWAMSLERRFRWLMLGIDPADIMRAVDLARQDRLVCVDGDREDVLPGVDLHAAFDTHTWGCMYVRVRNDLAANSQDTSSSPATSLTPRKTSAASIPMIPSTSPSASPPVASSTSS